MVARIVKADGTIILVEPDNHTDFKYTEIQKVVGGCFEMVTTGDGQLMFVNEQGKIDRLPVNRAATRMLHTDIIDIIVGDVLICDRSEVL